MTIGSERTIAGLLVRMDVLAAELEAERSPGRHFLSTYARTTRAVAAALEDGRFEDPPWVEEWDVAFADLYVDALRAYRRSRASAPRPWRVAFEADPSLPPIAHLLLGMNAHINYDLPQALIEVIPPDDVGDTRLMERRRRDHERIDRVLIDRVAAEDVEVKRATGALRLIDHVMTPLNQAATKRFLKEARQKVWHNTLELHRARVRGEPAYRRRLDDLEVLSAAKINDLLRPGAVVVRLGLIGFGVTLPPE
ncbi:MAG TPA: DUF5995 family protein [Kineosporiaceae bacterium]|nr:DUF5995 family protein [Kineosporiaceae bacterium]